jgi:hypothetical protein
MMKVGMAWPHGGLRNGIAVIWLRLSIVFDFDQWVSQTFAVPACIVASAKRVVAAFLGPGAKGGDR